LLSVLIPDKLWNIITSNIIINTIVGESSKIELNNKRKKQCFSKKSYNMVSICKVVVGCHLAYGTLETSASEMALYSIIKRVILFLKAEHYTIILSYVNQDYIYSKVIILSFSLWHGVKLVSEMTT